MGKWSVEIKNEARRLRKKGASYPEICSIFKVPKSTLFEWIKDIKPPGYNKRLDNLTHLEKIRILSSETIKIKRKNKEKLIVETVAKEVNRFNLSRGDIRESILAMLYWTEGSKGRGCLTFANTDPHLVLLYITLLREHPDFDNKKLRARLHLHYYHPKKKTKQYWSKLLNIPESQFTKTHIKLRSKTKKFRRNFMGICFIAYHSENLRFEILERGKQIAQIIAPLTLFKS
jgi:hypothetical protein